MTAVSDERNDSSPTAASQKAPENTVATAATDARSAARILVVEDLLINQTLVKAMINSVGFEAVIAESGQAAIDAVQRENFDLIFMDLQMPNMDGLEATQVIRRLGGQLTNIPIIALTANAVSVEIAQCLAAGMNDFMTKPASRSSLKSMIDKWITQSGAPAA